MIKLSVTEPQVSYLTYPDFDRDPHPTLRSAITVNLRKLTVDWRDYSRSENPPLLHRKEEFLGVDDPRRAAVRAADAGRDAGGLYEHPERIGTLKGGRRRWPQPAWRCGAIASSEVDPSRDRGHPQVTPPSSSSTDTGLAPPSSRRPQSPDR